LKFRTIFQYDPLKVGPNLERQFPQKVCQAAPQAVHPWRTYRPLRLPDRRTVV